MANSLNRVTLIGSLIKDPEIKVIQSGSRFTKFTMATNEFYKDKTGEWKELTDWHYVTCWDYVADKAAKISKGSKIYVEGKIKTRSYQDKDGVTKYVTEILASTIISMTKEERTEGGGYSGGGGNYNNNNASQSAPQNSNEADEYPDVDEDDVPF